MIIDTKKKRKKKRGKLKFMMVLFNFLSPFLKGEKKGRLICSLEFGLTKDVSNFVGGTWRIGKLGRIEKRKKKKNWLGR